jgi:hypothetical protein
MKKHFERFTFSTIELAACGFFAVLLSLAANSAYVLHYYGISEATGVIGSSIGNLVNTGLVRLDSYQLTPTIVTFSVWALVGLFVLSVVHAVARVFGEIAYQHDLTTNHYVHPANFNRRKFLVSTLQNLLASFVAFCAAIALFTLFFLYVLPIGIVYTRVLLLDPSLINALYGLLGVAVLAVGLAFLVFAVRLVAWRLHVIGLD